MNNRFIVGLAAAIATALTGMASQKRKKEKEYAVKTEETKAKYRRDADHWDQKYRSL